MHVKGDPTSEWPKVAVYLYVLLRLRNLCRYHVILRRTYDERVCTSTRFGVRRLSAVNYILTQERKYQGAKVPGSKSSRERKFHVTFAPGSESSRERKYQGAKVPPMVLSLLGAKVRGNESSSYLVLPLEAVARPRQISRDPDTARQDPRQQDMRLRHWKFSRTVH